jgi:hypothetical protein
MLNPNWTYILNELVETQTQIDCCIKYQYCNKSAYAKGICAECKGEYLFENPLKTLEGQMQSKITIKVPIDPEKHHFERKRKISNKLREQMKMELKGSTPNTQFESLILKNGVNSRRTPHLNTIQKISSEKRLELRISDDEFSALRMLNNSRQFNNVIKNLQIFPDFVVVFSSKNQDKILKSSKKYVLTIDATGSLFRDPFFKERNEYELNNHNNKPYYLYSAMFKDLSNPKTIPIMQCISQNHSTAGTINWLSTGYKDITTHPFEVRVDASSMLILACSKFFNGTDTNSYLKLCYESLCSNQNLIKTIIRIDKSHMIKLMSRWKLWNESKCGRVTKYFYINTLKKILEEKNFEKIKNVLRLLFIIMHSPYQSSLQENSIQSIYEYKGDMNNIEENEVDEVYIKKEYDESIEENQITGIVWHEEILEEVKIMLTNETTNEIKRNNFYLPEFEKDILRVMKIVPLWTSIMCSIEEKLETICTTSAVESEFKTIKYNMLKNHRPPISPHIFIQLFVQHADAQCLLYEKNLKSGKFIYDFFFFKEIQMFFYFSKINF